MAAIATKLSRTMLPSPAPTGKLLAVALINLKVPSASIYGKTMAGELEKPPPAWNYKRWGYNYWYSLLDGTTKRFTDNTRVVVVDGPPAIGKTEFAKGLAEELGMLYVAPACMDDIYITPYGFDLRELDCKMKFVRNKSFCEKKFAQDPTGQEGGLDRMQLLQYRNKFVKYVDALAHLFNTGQGIVMEKSPFNDYVYTEALVRQGWIDPTTKSYYHKIRAATITEILRPNLIIYLDAPTSVVQANIRKRAETTHPWEKGSPVYENTDYLNTWSDLNKKDYLKEASLSSQVLVYDWSEGGDAEIVVEDIEALNIDYHDKYDKQQMDWRMHLEENYSQKRAYYTQRREVLAYFSMPYFEAEKVWLTAEENDEWSRLYSRVPGNRFLPGYNEDMGDPNPLWKFGGQKAGALKVPDYTTDSFIDDMDSNHEDRVRASKRAAGDPKWWSYTVDGH